MFYTSNNDKTLYKRNVLPLLYSKPVKTEHKERHGDLIIKILILLNIILTLSRILIKYSQNTNLKKGLRSHFAKK